MTNQKRHRLRLSDVARQVEACVIAGDRLDHMPRLRTIACTTAQRYAYQAPDDPATVSSKWSASGPAASATSEAVIAACWITGADLGLKVMQGPARRFTISGNSNRHGAACLLADMFRHQLDWYLSGLSMPAGTPAVEADAFIASMAAAWMRQTRESLGLYGTGLAWDQFHIKHKEKESAAT